MIRPATPADVPAIVALVRELALFEREPDACKLTETGLAEALFADHPALFGHVAVADDGPSAGHVVGIALWFLNFSTWVGVHGIYLEDLYVRESERRAGHGLALLRELARIASERGYGRLEWSVLNWNVNAHAFYRKLGATPMDEWTVWRMTGDAIAALAKG